MRILVLMRVHNGESLLQDALDRLAGWCDGACVLNERSTDRTAAILRNHPIVKNFFSVDPAVSSDAWFLPEWRQFDLLYRMADNSFPDWVVFLDHDERLEADVSIRNYLAAQPADIAGVRVPLVSVWSDPEYPQMVPLMGDARGSRIIAWRHFMGAPTWHKRFHNRHYPRGLEDRGAIVDTAELRLVHLGWDTLQARLERVDLYTKIDPTYELNGNRVPYDRALLFGYARDEIDALIAEYRRRLERLRGPSEG